MGGLVVPRTSDSDDREELDALYEKEREAVSPSPVVNPITLRRRQAATPGLSENPITLRRRQAQREQSITSSLMPDETGGDGGTIEGANELGLNPAFVRTNPERAQAMVDARKEVESLSFFDKAADYVGDIGRSTKASYRDVQISEIRSLQATRILTGSAQPLNTEERMRLISLSRERDNLRAQIEDRGLLFGLGDPNDFAAQLPIMLETMAFGALPGAIAGGAAGAGAGFLAGGPAGASVGARIGAKGGANLGSAVQAFGLEQGLAFDEYLAMVDPETGEPVSEQEAATAATIVGFANAAIELLPISFAVQKAGGAIAPKAIFRDQMRDLLADATTRASLGRIAKAYAGAVARELPTELVQELATFAGGEHVKGTPIGLVFGMALDNPERFQEILVATLNSGGVTGAPTAGFQTATEIRLHHMSDGEKVQRNQQIIDESTKIVTSSKLGKKKPDVLQAEIAKSVKGTSMETIAIPADKLDEHLADDEEGIRLFEAVMPDFADRLKKAKETGGDVELTFADYMARIAPTEHHKALREDIRLTSDLPTTNELREALKQERDTMVRLIDDENERTRFQQSSDVVFEDIKTQLRATGRYADEKDIDANALQWSAMVDTSALRLGITPEEFREKYPYGILGPGRKQPVQGPSPNAARTEHQKVVNRTRELRAKSLDDLEATAAVEGIDVPDTVEGAQARKAYIVRALAGLPLDTEILAAPAQAPPSTVVPEPEEASTSTDRTADLRARVIEEDRQRGERMPDDPVAPEQGTLETTPGTSTPPRAVGSPVEDTPGLRAYNRAERIKQLEAQKPKWERVATRDDDAIRKFRQQVRLAGGMRLTSNLTKEDFGAHVPGWVFREKARLTWDQWLQEAAGLGLIEEDAAPDEFMQLFRGRLTSGRHIAANEKAYLLDQGISIPDYVDMERQLRADDDVADGDPYIDEDGMLVVDGEVLFQPAPKTDSPAFKNWFGDSKVVDADGNPLVVYHGTPTGGFTEFDAAQFNTRTNGESGSRDAFFFTRDADSAEAYAGDTGVVMPVYLQLQNPKMLERSPSAEDIATAKINGHDGIITPYEFAVFSPTQIKSATANRGTFDPNNPSILYQDSKKTESPEFRRWFGNSKVVDEKDEPIVVYHGTKRPDRVGNRFQKSRATSGPSAYFTTDPSTASGYALTKNDTSIEMPPYTGWFKFKPHGSRATVDIDRAWYQLTPEQRQKIAQTIPHVVNVDEDGNEMEGFRLGDPDEYGLTGKDHWDYTIRQYRGNVLRAAVDIWLDSAGLFNDEEQFLEVLRLGGAPMDRIKYESPMAEHPGVFPVYLSIQNPLDTGSIPQSVVDSLDKRSRRQKSPKVTSGDPWDKDNQDPIHWMDELKADIAQGKNSYVWTSVPNWVTSTLQELGYDGIHDTGGKGGGDPHTVWIPFRPTQIKSKNNRGTFDPSNPNILRQGPDATGNHRGSFRRIPGIRAQNIIELSEHSDFSTFLHESAHAYLFILNDIVTNEPNAPVEFAEDLQTTLEWLGAKSFKELTREQHEKFADAYLSYLSSGEAPSTRLETAFKRYRRWLLSLYRALRLKHVPIDDRIRMVFDRMLATDEEIARSASAPLLGRDSFKSDAEYESYQKKFETIAEEARRRLDGDTVRKANVKDATAYNKRRAEIKKQVEAELDETPLYMALEAMEGDPDSGVPPIRLNARMARRTMGERSIEGRKQWIDADALSVFGRIPKRYLDDNGVDPEIAAKSFGFSTGRELLEAIGNRPKRKEQVEAEVNKRLEAELYADPTDDADTDKAQEALHSSAAENALLAELDAFNRLTGRTRVRASVYKRFARDTVAAQQVGMVRPDVYLRDERKAARAAQRAYAKKDLETATIEKQRQLLNQYLYSEALKAKKEIRSAEKELRQLSEKGTRKGIPYEFLEQIDGLLANFDLAPMSMKQAGRVSKNAKDFIDGLLDSGEENVRFDLDLALMRPQNYKTLTMEEFLSLRDSVRNLVKLGRDQKKITLNDERLNLEDVLAKLRATLRINVNADKTPRAGADRATDKFIGVLENGLTTIRKMGAIAQFADGLEQAGEWFNTIIRPFRDAEVRREQRLEQFTRRFVEVMPASWKGRLTEGFLGERIGAAVSRKFGTGAEIRVDGTERAYSFETVLMLAMNWGNADGRQRVSELKDRGITPQVARNLIDTLRKEDWEAIQAIWDLLDEFWPEIAELERRTTGVVPEKVEPILVSTRHGDYRGGYFPIVYDPDKSSVSPKKEEKLDNPTAREFDVIQGSRAQTRKGHTHARVGSGGRVLRLSLDVITNHARNVIHDLEFREPGRGIGKIVNDKDFRADFVEAFGKPMLDTMDKWFARNVRGGLKSEGIVSFFRHKTVTAIMGYSLVTSVKQLLGIIPAGHHVGLSWVAHGLHEFYGHPTEIGAKIDHIFASSPFMRNRVRAFERDARREIATIRKSGIRRMADFIERYAFVPIATMQMAVDFPVWIGAYHKQLESMGIDPKQLKKSRLTAVEARMHKAAVSAADDAVVSSQGSGLTVDQTALEAGETKSGEFGRLLTTFGSYFSQMYNQQANATRRAYETRNPADALNALSAYMFYVAVPAFMEAMVVALVTKQDEPDDPEDLESWIKFIARKEAAALFSLTPLTRDISDTVIESFGYSGPAGLSILELSTRDIEKLGDGKWDFSDFKAINRAVALGMPIPALQIERTIEGIIAIEEGEADNPVEAAQGLAFGTK